MAVAAAMALSLRKSRRLTWDTVVLLINGRRRSHHTAPIRDLRNQWRLGRRANEKYPRQPLNRPLH